MNESAKAQEGRRLVRRITLTYTLEGDESGTEHTLIVEGQPDGAGVDGLVWSRGLMDRLAYVGEGGQPVPQRPGRAQDGWTRRRGHGNGGGNGGNGGNGGSGGGSGADAAGAAAMSDPVDECIWLHTESCSWMSLCDPG